MGHRHIALPQRTPLSALIIGGGCVGLFTATALRSIGIKVTVLSPTLFGIADCTFKATQVHASGLEYINNLGSAQDLIRGGVEFIKRFGPDGWHKLVDLGILEPTGTRFKFPQATLRQNQPPPHIVRETLPLLEKYYLELKKLHPTITLPDRLFPEISPVDIENPFADILVSSIQPGIAIMRLGAVLKQHLDTAGVTWRVGTTIQNCTVGTENSQWIVDGNYYDVIVNATNANYPYVSQFLNTPVDHQHRIKNHRYQLYLYTKIPRPIPQTLTTGPGYTLCTTNSADVTTGFYGTMLDRTSLRTHPDTGELSSCLVLYAAGPTQDGIIGGGSWGKTGSRLTDPNWKGETPPEIVSAKVIHSVEKQFPELRPLEKKVAFLHDGYNINIETPGHRSDIRPFAQPEIARKTPLEIVAIGAKFTHSPTSGYETGRLVVNTLTELGKLDSESRTVALRQLDDFRIDLDQFSRDQLTKSTYQFCIDAGLPCGLAEYFCLPKVNWTRL